MTTEQLLLAIPGIGALILSLFQQYSLNKQNKRTADLDEAKMKFDQGNQLMEQQRQLINTLQGLLKDRDTTIQSMQSSVDNLRIRLDSYIANNAQTASERKDASSMLKMHKKEAEYNSERDRAFTLKLDALKPIERE